MDITFTFDIYDGLNLPLHKICDQINVLRKSSFVSKKGKQLYSYDLELVKGKERVRVACLSSRSEFPTDTSSVSLRLLSCEGAHGVYQMKYWL